MKVFVDSSVLVAGCVMAHPHFNRAFSVMRDAAGDKLTAMICAHSLVEVFSALTSIPVKPRITPGQAREMIRHNIEQHFSIIQPSRTVYRRAMDRCVARGQSGGVVYDALLLECARSRKFDRLYTFNLGHFTRLAPELADKITAP